MLRRALIVSGQLAPIASIAHATKRIAPRSRVVGLGLQRYVLGCLALALLAASGARADTARMGPVVRVTHAGEDRNVAVAALSPGVAVNAGNGEALVAWAFHDARMSDRVSSAYAQRVDAAGTPLGEPIRLTPDDRGFPRPLVVFNRRSGEYLVVVVEPGVSVVRISADGRLLDTQAVPIGRWRSAVSFGLTYNSVRGDYLVTWSGIRKRRAAAYGLRLGTDGRPLETRVRRLSPFVRAKARLARYFSSAIAFHPAHNQYLVAWEDERRVLRRRLSAVLDPVGRTRTIQARSAYDLPGHVPAIAAGGTGYLMAWRDSTVVRVQSLNDKARPVDRPRRISTAKDGFSARFPDNLAISFDPRRRQYLLAWEDACTGDTPGEIAGCDPTFIWGQLLDAKGRQLGRKDILISPKTPEGEKHLPALAFNPVIGSHLVAWHGPVAPRTSRYPSALYPIWDQETEILARLLSPATGG